MASRLDDLIREHAERLDQLAGPIALTDVTRGPRTDTVTLIDSDLTPTQPDGARRWPVIAVAAALVAIAVGGLMLVTGDEDPTSKVPADQHSTNAVITVAPRRGTGVFEGGGQRVTYIVPDGWSGRDAGVWKSTNRQLPAPNRQLPVFFVNTDDALYINCPSSVDDPQVGPTVDGLVSALVNLPGVDAETTDVTLDGFDGKQIEFTFPSQYVGEECSPDFGARAEGIPLYYRCNFGGVGDTTKWCDSLVQGVFPGRHQKIWVLDVDGSRLVITAASLPDTSQQDRADQDEIVASIQIG